MHQENGLPALLKRLVMIGRANPAILKTLARMEYRHRWGISRDRRLRPGSSAPPTNLALCLTLRCNLTCVMCRQNRHTQEVAAGRPWFAEELPLAPWVSLLEQLKEVRPWIYLTGGEPTVYPFLREFIQEAKARRFLVQLQTNGTLLEPLAAFLVEQGVEAVTVSLDGPPEVHDQIRGVPGTFRRIRDGVQALVEARRSRGAPNPVLSFNFTITKNNVPFLGEMVPLVLSLGADALQIQHTMFNSPELVARHNRWFSPERVAELGLEMAQPSVAEDEYYESEITPEDLPVLLRGLARVQQQARGRLLLVTLPNLPPALVAPYYLDLNYPFVQKCDMFWKTLRVLADGTVSPCLNFKVGNIARQSFAEIWNGPQMARLRRLFADRLFPGCARCCQRHYLTGSRAF